MIYLVSYQTERTHIDQTQTQTDQRQLEHMLGRTLLKVGLQREYALFLPGLSMSAGQYGKPYLEKFPDIHFNISHCDGLVVCGIHNRAIGVDVERVRPFSDKLVSRIFSEEERRAFEEIQSHPEGGESGGREELFFRYWTLKESGLKAAGYGLSVPMREFSFAVEDGAQEEKRQAQSWRKVRCSRPGYEFYQRCLWGTHILSICIEENQ